MLPCEVKWETSQQADPAFFAREFETFCLRPRPRPTGDHVKDVRKTVESLLFYFVSGEDYINPCYMLARHWGVFTVESHGDQYPLWLHNNDVPTLQAARSKNPDLGAYLRDRAKVWSSNYIAADLRIDVWASRACLDLYGYRTPSTADRPKMRPRGEIDYVHDSGLINVLIRRGYTPGQVAIELGVTDRFLRAHWKSNGIDPALDQTQAKASANHAEWLADLREGVSDVHPSGRPCVRSVESVGDASKCWGISFQAARKRLIALGWQPYNAVADMLGIRRTFAELNSWTGVA